MAEAVVSFVVERLGDFTIQEAKFLYGVSDQIKLAQTELQFMRGFLKDADVKQRDDETVRLCVAEIKDAAYDLEDVIEIYAFKVVYKRRGAGFKYVLRRFACFMNEGVYLYKIGSEIKSITARISELRLRMQTYNIREVRETSYATSMQLSETQQQLRRTYSHVVEGDVVGLDDDVTELVTHLVKEETCHRVISIWGMGGSGKTTLAKQVYHHKEVQSHFDCTAWICISQRCKVREVWEGILVKLRSHHERRGDIIQMSDDEVAKNLFLVQKERRCLVVFDDIWSIQAWDSLKAAFPLNQESKSKILLTTRYREVAVHSDRNGFLHQPRPLNNVESWELFEKIAIIGRDQIYPEIYSKMTELGKRMLEHCAGLPLAITVLAGLLYRKDIKEWEAVSNNVHRFISRGKGHQQEYSSVSRVLELSYDDLPFYLKPCFLYLGNFPENSVIKVKELTQLWIAEGFISSANQRQGSSEKMEDVAYNWLRELVERCMVQIGMPGSIRKIKSCRLHDLVREMCLLKAEEESFLQVITLHNNKATHPPSSMETKAKSMAGVRRLTIHVDENVDKMVSKDEIDDRIRSLLYFEPKCWEPKNNKKLIQSMFKDFKLLRVLKIERMHTYVVKLPSEIGKMVHLRYLSLRSSAIKRLPPSVANLTCLQTLNLDIWGGRLKSPNVVGNMKQLRHLYFPMFFSTAVGEQKLSSLVNLQTLQISSNDFDCTDLAELTSLRSLTIQLERPLKNMKETLNSTSITLNRIRSLCVLNRLGIMDSSEEVTKIVSSCRHIYKLRVDESILELPQDPHWYPNITKLSLNWCTFKDDQMAIIEKLPNLRKFLFDLARDENRKTLVCSQGGFPRLEVLSAGTSNVHEWVVEEGAMPNLSELSITYWRNLRKFPEGFRYITTLKELKITGLPRTVCTRLQEGGEDFYLVQHVPSVTIEHIYGP